MEKLFNIKAFKPYNDSMLAKYLEVGAVMIFKWKREDRAKYNAIVNFWKYRCKLAKEDELRCESDEDFDIDAINNILKSNKLSPISKEHINFLNELIIKNKILGK